MFRLVRLTCRRKFALTRTTATKAQTTSRQHLQEGVDLSQATREERARLVAELFEKHNRALVTFLRAKLHNDAEAREVAQEAYVKLLQLEEPGVVSFLQAYLFKIAANIAIDRIRRHAVDHRIGQEDAHLFDEADESASPGRICIGRHEIARISNALEVLPEKGRQAFALHVLLERPIREVAIELKISTRMVSYYLADAMRIVKRVRDEGSS